MTTSRRLVVRVRTEADLPACAAALMAVHAVDGYPVEGVPDLATAQAWLCPAGLIQAWVAELDGQPVGHALIAAPGPGDAAAVMWLFAHPEDEGRIAVGGRLFVHPDGRGHGAARRLMEVATTDTARRGLRVALDVMAKDTVAIALYDKLGMQRIGATEHDDGHGNLVPALCYITPATPRNP